MRADGERRAKRATADSASLIRGSPPRGLEGAFDTRSSPSTPVPRRRPLVSDATSASMDASLSLALHGMSRAPQFELLEKSKLELLLTAAVFASHSGTVEGGGEHCRRVNFPLNDLLGGRMVKRGGGRWYWLAGAGAAPPGDALCSRSCCSSGLKTEGGRHMAKVVSKGLRRNARVSQLAVRSIVGLQAVVAAVIATATAASTGRWVKCFAG